MDARITRIKLDETFSEINRDIAQILFAVLVIQPFVTQEIRYDLILFGLFGSIGFWAWSMRVLKKTYGRS